ncbi:hypothetical protein [Niallia sp. NCCP-28]|uniref:hypothetical protein n=1 Tax=Niallia sp. NCCP-28 TaxID=2934712 RepID=UPI0020BF523B|nr:hypothetical protein [Niallia sp. NCCP-28]
MSGEDNTEKASSSESKKQATETTTTDTSKEESTKEESTKEEPSKDDEGVLTQEKFEQIKDGMSYEEVVSIVGAEGTVMSETGEKGTEFHTVMYDFETDGAFFHFFF